MSNSENVNRRLPLKVVDINNVYNSSALLGLNVFELGLGARMSFVPDENPNTTLEKFTTLISSKQYRDELALARMKALSTSSELLSCSESGNIVPKTISKNLRVLENSTVNVKRRMTLNNRVDNLAKFASLHLPNSPDSNRISLCIGPRSEYEIFSLLAHGVKRIVSIDLLSYSDLITPFDLYELDGSIKFDLIVMGYVLPYLNKPSKAIAMISKCLNPGGILAIGSSRTFESIDEWNKSGRNEIVSGTKIVFSSELALESFITDATGGRLEKICQSTPIISLGAGSDEGKNELKIIKNGSINMVFQKIVPSMT